MTYLPWAVYYEGTTDQAYFDVLLPRIMEHITLLEGTREVTIPSTPAAYLGRMGRQIENVAREACEASDSYHILFIHADTGGRALATTLGERGTAYCKAIHDMCGWRSDRCVILAPCHETEAWALADPKAVTDALGYRGKFSELDLPADAAEAERLPDPKAVLDQAARLVQGRRARRGGSQLLPSIAQVQTIDSLRGSVSFRIFEEQLRNALISLGCLARNS